MGSIQHVLRADGTTKRGHGRGVLLGLYLYRWILLVYKYGLR